MSPFLLPFFVVRKVKHLKFYQRRGGGGERGGMQMQMKYRRC